MLWPTPSLIAGVNLKWESLGSRQRRLRFLRPRYFHHCTGALSKTKEARMHAPSLQKVHQHDSRARAHTHTHTHTFVRTHVRTYAPTYTPDHSPPTLSQPPPHLCTSQPHPPSTQAQPVAQNRMLSPDHCPSLTTWFMQLFSIDQRPLFSHTQASLEQHRVVTSHFRHPKAIRLQALRSTGLLTVQQTVQRSNKQTVSLPSLGLHVQPSVASTELSPSSLIPCSKCPASTL